MQEDRRRAARACRACREVGAAGRYGKKGYGKEGQRMLDCPIVIYRLDLHDVDVVLFLIVMDADR